MLQKIVVGFDASPASIGAAQWASAFATPSAGQVTLVHAVAPGGALDGVDTDLEVLETANALFSAGDRDGSTSPAVNAATVEFVSRAGDAGQILSSVCDEIGADLLVLGTDPVAGTDASSDQSRLARELLQDASTPLALVPRGVGAPSADTEWIVGVDGQSGAANALAWAAEAAEQSDGHITAVLAYDPAADSFPHPEEPAWTYPGELETHGQLDAAGGRIREFRTVAGGPTEVLRRTAAELARPTVIVAGINNNPLTRPASIGKVPSSLVNATPWPVVVVPAGAGVAVSPGDPHRLDESHVIKNTPDETVVEAPSVEEARELVSAAERAGDDASLLHIDGAALPGDRDAIQRNDRANISAATRPAVAMAAAGAIILAAIALLGALVGGASTLLTVVAALGGVIVGGVLGALAGMYGNLVINRDAIDLRERREHTPVAVREGHARGADQTVGYVEEREREPHQPRKASRNA